MADNLQFAIQIMDFAWFAAIAIRALSWMMLCHGPVWKWRHPGRAAAEAFTLAAALTVGLLFLALIGGRGLHLLPQLFSHGAAGARGARRRLGHSLRHGAGRGRGGSADRAGWAPPGARDLRRSAYNPALMPFSVKYY